QPRARHRIRRVVLEASEGKGEHPGERSPERSGCNFSSGISAEASAITEAIADTLSCNDHALVSLIALRALHGDSGVGHEPLTVTPNRRAHIANRFRVKQLSLTRFDVDWLNRRTSARQNTEHAHRVH